MKWIKPVIVKYTTACVQLWLRKQSKLSTASFLPVDQGLTIMIFTFLSFCWDCHDLLYCVIFTSVHLSSEPLRKGHSVLQPMAAITGQEAGNTLDKSSVHHRAPFIFQALLQYLCSTQSICHQSETRCAKVHNPVLGFFFRYVYNMFLWPCQFSRRRHGKVQY